jgi:hypothetical protein
MCLVASKWLDALRVWGCISINWRGLVLDLILQLSNIIRALSYLLTSHYGTKMRKVRKAKLDFA